MKAPFNILTSLQSSVLALFSCLLILASCKGCSTECDPPCTTYKVTKPKASFGPPIIHSPDAVPVLCNKNNRDYFESMKMVTLDLARLDTIEVLDTVLAVLDQDSALIVLKSRKDDCISKTWTFSSADSLNGKASLIYRGGDSLSFDGFMTGSLSYGGNDYELRKCNQGSYLLGKIDFVKLTAYDSLPHVDTTGKIQSENNCDQAYGNAVIDLLVVYTDLLRQEYGVLGIEAEILLSIAVANESFAKNGIPVRLNLNHIAEYNLEGLESTSLDLHYKLDSFVIGNNELDDLRNDFHSDLTMVFVKNANSLHNGYASKSKAAAILRAETASTRYLFAHEIGHLLIGDKHEDSCLTIIDGTLVQTIMGNVPHIPRVPEYFFDEEGCHDYVLDKIIAGAHKVAAYRCPMLIREALISDLRQDNGIEPSSTGEDAVQLLSPFIYLRNDPDPMRIHLYRSDDSIAGGDNYLYVIVRNGSSRIVNGSLTAYRNCKSISAKISELEIIGTDTEVSIAGESIQVVEIKIPAGTLTSEDCGFVVQFHKNNVPDPLPPNRWVVDWVRNSNQVAGRSASVINLKNNLLGASNNAFRVLNPCSSIKSIPFRNLSRDSIRIWFSPSPETQQTFLEAGGTLNYSFYEDSTFNSINEQVINPNAPVQKIPTPQKPWVLNNKTSLFYFTVCPNGIAVDASYPVHIEQWNKKGITGAHTFILKTSSLPTP